MQRSDTVKTVPVQELLALWANIDAPSEVPSLEQLLDHPLLRRPLLLADPYMYFIYDHRVSHYAFISSNSQEIIGYAPEEMYAGSGTLIFDRASEADKLLLLDMFKCSRVKFDELPLERKLGMKLVMHHDIVDRNGNRRNVLLQYFPLYIDKKNMLVYSFSLVVHQPWALPQPSATGALSYTSTEGERKVVYLPTEKMEADVVFTAEEMEIVRMLAQGFTADAISISIKRNAIETADLQRSVLKKTGSQNLQQLIRYCVERGMI